MRKIGFAKLTPLEEALKVLFSHVKETPKESIETVKALNRILDEKVTSEIDVPPFDKSAMDGYAVIAENTFGASPKNPKTIKKIGAVEIGQTTDKTINPGEAIQISTGAPVPEGADAVIKIEETEIEDNLITLYNSVVPGKNISKRGEDIKVGTEIFDDGTEIKAEHIALLSSLGLKELSVSQKPRVSVYAVGDELIEVGNPLKPSKIYNSNSPMISNLVRLYGGQIIRESSLKDDKEALKQNLLEASKDSQIIIFTGGTSVGTKDFLPEIVGEFCTILHHGVAMRPGAPILTSYLNDTLVFCLPGTPVAAYIGYLIFVGPALRKMMGCKIIDPRIKIMATISKDVPVSGMGRVSFLRVKLQYEENEIIAQPVKLKGSGIISSITNSDGIVEIPPQQEGLKKGDKVLVKLFPK